MKLEWRPHPDPLSLGRITSNGRYTVSSIEDGVWQAWKIAPGGPWFAMLGLPRPTREAAMALCDADAQA